MRREVVREPSQKVWQRDKNDDPMTRILLNLVVVDPKEWFTADQCLQRGLEATLFRTDQDGQIVLEYHMEAKTLIKTPPRAGSPDDEEKVPTPQSPQLAETTELRACLLF